MYGSYSNGLYALKRYQRVFSLIIVIICELRSLVDILFLLVFFFFSLSFLCLFVLQLFNIIHLTAGACLVHDDPDKTQTLFEFN